MSLLEQQLKELQTKKAKVAYFKEILSALDLLSKPSDLDESAVEARRQAIVDITDFVEVQISAIENGEPQTPIEIDEAKTNQLFTAEEVGILRTIISLARDRANNQKNPANTGAFSDESVQPAAPKKPETPGQKAKRQDKIQFGLANRHLDQKRVIVSQNGKEIAGVVVGLDAPNVIVKTDTGHTVPVDLDNITLE